MSAKRPRPAIPVLVHVDNPSSGGGSGDLTTVNENTTTLKNIVGTNDSTIADTSLIGAARNLVASVGNFNSTPSTAGSTVRSFLFNLREGIGSSTSTPTATDTSVRGLLTAIKENTASGGGGGGSSADLTTVNEKTTALAEAIGPASSTSSDDNIFGHVRNLQYAVGDSTKAPSAAGNSVRDLLTVIKTSIGLTASGTGDRNLIGHVINLVGSIGDFNSAVTPSGGTVKAFLNNIRDGIGNSTSDPTTAGNTVRDLLLALKTVTGTLNSSSKDTDLIGCVRNLRVAVGASGNQLLPGGDSVRSFLLNLRTAIGDSTQAPSATENTVRGLLTAIKQNTASGGSGGSADLTIVNEKTTALAAAIGSASDSSSTVSVIGLLKSITDKY